MKIYNQKNMLLFSIFNLFLVFNAYGIISLQENPIKALNYERTTAEYGNIEIAKSGESENLGYIDDDQISLCWFIHITDLHLSASNIEYYQDFERFLKFSYENIHPFTTIVTGDLQNGQKIDNFYDLEGKVREDYLRYFEAVNSSKYSNDSNPYRYVEVSGNHDRNLDWGADFFLNYTLAGTRLGSIQNFFSANFSTGNIIFSLLDSAAPLEGAAIPFGSEGNLDKIDLEEYLEFLQQNIQAETKFTFQHHHPLETFGLSNYDYKGNIRIASEYGLDCVFYGHMHEDFVETFGDVPYIMGDLFPDTEINENGQEYSLYNYHIVSVDNNGINYINTAFSDPIAIIITNPSNPLFLDDNDPIKDIRGDGNIRVLIFDDNTDPITNVEYKVDNGNWKHMSLYQNSQILYESYRDDGFNSDNAIPDDGKNHYVVVRVKTESGATYYQFAEATDKQKRKPITEFFIKSAILTLIGICAHKVLIKKSSIRRTLKKFRLHRNSQNRKRRGSNFFFTLFLAEFLSLLFIPWGIFPMFQGSTGVVYTFICLYSNDGIHALFLFETFMYSCLRIFFVLPLIYRGIQKKN